MNHPLLKFAITMGLLGYLVSPVIPLVASIVWLWWDV